MLCDVPDSSPFLLLLVHGDAARPEGHHHQQAANDGEGLKDEILAHSYLQSLQLHLEEIVFEEVSHGLVGGDSPPGVEVEVEDVEPHNQNKRAQLRLVADRHQNHQDGTNQVLYDVHH